MDEENEDTKGEMKAEEFDEDKEQEQKDNSEESDGTDAHEGGDSKEVKLCVFFFSYLLTHDKYLGYRYITLNFILFLLLALVLHLGLSLWVNLFVRIILI